MAVMVDSARRRIGTARRGAALLGPALVAAAAYIDPGNVATNTAAGAEYGYLLVWVVVAANVMACLVQYLSAKLGLVTGQSLPEAVGTRMPRRYRLMYWAQAELVCIATDLAEVLGGAIALSLLFGLPLVWGGVITTMVSLAILAVRDRGSQRRFEQLIGGLLAVVAIGFLAGLFVRPPDATAVAGGLLPRLDGTGSLLLAVGMLGATVMPHAIYLHSALARDRHGHPEPGPVRRRLLAVTKADVVVALLLAGAVNLGLVLLGASALDGGDTSTLEGVFAALGANLGQATALLFAVALLFSGLASTSVGCYAGAAVMGGLLRLRIPLIARRVVTAIPALVVLGSGFDPTAALILSQVVLSFGIPFALIPLVMLTSRRSVMGPDVNRAGTTAAAIGVTLVIVALNVALLGLTFSGA